jgi:hypothetical protein
MGDEISFVILAANYSEQDDQGNDESFHHWE